MIRRVRALLLLATAVLVACSDADAPAAPTPTALFSCVYSDGISLGVGEALEGRPAEGSSACVKASPGGAEYLVVPFHAASSGASVLHVDIAAGGSARPGGGTAATAAAQAHGHGRPLMIPLEPERDWDFHLALREHEIRELTPLIPAARTELGAGGSSARGARARGAAAASVPEVGDLVELNAGTICSPPFRMRTGRVRAVGQHSVVIADTLNPAGGFSTQDYNHFAATFDTLVYPLNQEHFGDRTDLDGSGRTTLFFTRAVNELTPPGANVFIAGFFWAGDLFPQVASSGLQGCPGSNVREMFYLVVPDPTGETGNVRQTDFVRRITVGVVGHEDQHLINAARRIYLTDATQFEQTWLNEALSHTAEELLFYAATPFGPGQNLGQPEVFGSEELADRFFEFAAPNLGNYGRFLENVENESPLGLDRLTTRGAAWALLRYLVDHQERPQPAFLRDLVGGPRTGLDNLSDALGRDAMPRLQEWAVSIFTDDVVPGVAPRFTQPSWNFRSILQGFGQGSGFPLPVRDLPPASPQRIRLNGGTASFLEFGVAPGGRALLDFSVDGGPPPARLRWTVVRTN